MEFKNSPALILIDIQKGLEEVDYYGGCRNNPEAEHRAADLLAIWREKKYPVYHIKHDGNPPSPLSPGTPGNDFKDMVTPGDGETIVEKNTNSAFLGTPLHQMLQDSGITDLVLVGLTTAHCVSSTARMAGNLGYNTFVVSDATATFDTLGPDGTKYEADLVHRICLSSLHREFATVIESDILIPNL
ncbi:cysteine hydrolase family protein [Muriicola marianensis]|uniref:Isochorismatase n=1 Tax=Muriicola marianensis TaxID=1324801 RepID=A0ABQ1QTU5_9FLAO|nr:cysteine hydrolase family protein [Muriicola marianensis]GGD43507.1 isochorismatase [Muriicola marianensis]